MVWFALWAGSARGQVVQVETALGTDSRGEGLGEMTLRVALGGLERGGRAPLNVALVLDRSAAMGPYLESAKRAIIAGLEGLAADDLVSLVAFDDTVEVLLESGRAGDLERTVSALDGVTASGKAGLFAGVVKGAFEVRKGLSRERVSRVILLSAGRAAVGPRGSAEFAQLAASLRREGIAVSSVGIGLDYDDEALLTLAEDSGGHHLFAESSDGLGKVLVEGLRQLATVVAKDVTVKVRLAPNVSVDGVIGRKAEVFGDLVVVPMPAVYGGLTDDVVMGIRARDLGPARQQVAAIEVGYINLGMGSREKVSLVAMTGTSRAQDGVRAAKTCWRALALRRQALALRDARRFDEALRLLDAGVAALRDAEDQATGAELAEDREALSDENLETRRTKLMRAHGCGPLGTPGVPSEIGKGRL
jgi:Ca-activated chloride channel family protein